MIHIYNNIYIYIYIYIYASFSNLGHKIPQRDPCYPRTIPVYPIPKILPSFGGIPIS